MVRTGVAAALLFLSTCCLGQGPGSLGDHPSRYLTPAAYPEMEASAVWKSLGASYVRKALRDNLLERDPALNARIDAVMTAIGDAAARVNPHYRGASWRALLIEDFGHGAVAFPGGTVLVDAGFVRRLKMTDNELALLLAHEVAHVLALHPAEKLSFVAKKVGKEKAPTAGSALLAFYSQDTYARLFQPTARLQEREADAIGAAVLFASGYDARRALDLFDKLAAVEAPGGETETSTHDSARVRKLAVSEALDALARDEALQD
jgi:predicted Zn-dependent protease